ncbi:MAG: polysaccharide deacetylase family protein [Cognaticolwellia sp.]|jgi:peptidoglycan/xylan/chitin deacetylase (PgdA/CDA1 family)
MLRKLKYLLRAIILPDRLFLLSKTQKEKTLYLTFDDGPVPGVIERLLDLLDKHQIQATFFVLGSRVEKNPDLLNEINKRAHTIANHSYSHPEFHHISHAEKIIEMEKTNLIIKQVTGKSCTLFRAPQGRWDMRLIFTLLLKKITAVHWSRDSMDFLKEPANKVVERFMEHPVKPGDIILFHDDHERCIEALDILIPQWFAQGYNFNALENKH